MVMLRGCHSFFTPAPGPACHHAVVSSRRSLVIGAALLVAVVALPVRTRSQAQLAALPAAPTAPPDNPTTPEKVALGRLLFWDPILSGQKDVACATCHLPESGYAERLDLSIGANGIGVGASRRFGDGNTIPFVKRNSQSVLNSAFNGIDTAGRENPSAAPMFWDVRVRSLEAQALEPIKAREEMRGDAYQESGAVDTVVARLNAIPDYRARFSRAFGGANAVTAANLARAIAAFERTLVATNSPFDRYMRGDTSAMTPLQVVGMERFARIGCANCHSGPMFSDFKPHVLGVPDNRKLTDSDAGTGGAYAFRTASLRNLTLTAPYMHNGTIATLDAVVQFYDSVRRGGRRGGRGGGGVLTRNPNVAAADLDPLLRRLNVNGDRRELVAFLEALTDTTFDRTVPASVPSGLPVGGRIK
jgi:cytochrome c peroxidase